MNGGGTVQAQATALRVMTLRFRYFPLAMFSEHTFDVCHWCHPFAKRRRHFSEAVGLLLMKSVKKYFGWFR